MALVRFLVDKSLCTLRRAKISTLDSISSATQSLPSEVPSSRVHPAESTPGSTAPLITFPTAEPGRLPLKPGGESGTRHLLGRFVGRPCLEAPAWRPCSGCPAWSPYLDPLLGPPAWRPCLDTLLRGPAWRLCLEALPEGLTRRPCLEALPGGIVGSILISILHYILLSKQILMS